MSKSVKKNKTKDIASNLDEFYSKIIKYIRDARQTISKNIDTVLIITYWKIGRDIVNEEQKGLERAAYGEEIITHLSKRLRIEFGRGFSPSNLRNMRKFYKIYKNTIQQTLSGEFEIKLTWSHYCLLLQLSKPEMRSFYELEATKNQWSVRHLDRQISTLLYERLAKSKDKKGVLRLATKGQEILTPEDAIKNPVVLEFLGLPESHLLIESKIEEALITHLQHFLLELGSGFAFIARQKRLKSDAVVKYTLGDKAKNIFASTYQFHLPTEEQLREEMIKETETILIQEKINKSK